MVSPAVALDREQQVVTTMNRFGVAILAANSVGALVAFLLGNFLIPAPPGVHGGDRLLLLNVVLFGLLTMIAMPLGWFASRRRSRRTLAWALDGRDPTPEEREATLRLPLAQQAIVALLWCTAAGAFSGLNGAASPMLGENVAVTIVLGGLVTCALGYLVTERQIRPIIAIALSTGVPAHPQLPGVAARAVLSWTLGTGAVLVGLGLVGISALHETVFTRHRLAIAIVVLVSVGLAAGLVATVALARSLSHPIESLRRALEGVAAGDFDQEVEVDDGSEVGLLQAGFNHMVAGLRERERLRDLFGRQVGEEVMRRALETGVALGGEARDAAVLFVDLEGSTALAERRDPAEVVGLLNAFFAIVVDTVGRHGGWVNKFEGDAALCVFGAPLPDQLAASHALTAARELRDRLRLEISEISAGIGVSAGRVVAGNIGAQKRFEYTVIGDPVNEAARLTEVAKRSPGRLLVSAAALEQADGEEAARWQISDELTLRGRSAPTTVATPC